MGCSLYNGSRRVLAIIAFIAGGVTASPCHRRKLLQSHAKQIGCLICRASSCRVVLLSAARRIILLFRYTLLAMSPVSCLLTFLSVMCLGARDLNFVLCGILPGPIMNIPYCESLACALPVVSCVWTNEHVLPELSMFILGLPCHACKMKLFIFLVPSLTTVPATPCTEHYSMWQQATSRNQLKTSTNSHNCTTHIFVAVLLRCATWLLGAYSSGRPGTAVQN
jgi:hypothetical protein